MKFYKNMRLRIYLRSLSIASCIFLLLPMIAYSDIASNQSDRFSILPEFGINKLGRHLRITISDPYHYSKIGVMFGRQIQARLGGLVWTEPNIQTIGIDYPIISLGAGYRRIVSGDQIRGIYMYYDINNLFSMVHDNKSIDDRITLGGEIISKRYRISANLHASRDCDIAIWSYRVLLPLRHIDRLETSPTKLGFNIKGSLNIGKHIVPSIGLYWRKVQRRTFRVMIENPRKSMTKEVINDYLGVSTKQGVVGGIEYIYNPVHSVVINCIYDNLTKFSISFRYQFKLDGYFQPQSNTLHTYLWKPVEHQIGPTFDKYIAPDRTAYRQRVQDLLADQDPIRDQLANAFNQKYSLVLRQETARFWLNLSREKREKILLTEDVASHFGLPNELKLNIMNYAFSGDRVGKLTRIDREYVRLGYRTDWRSQLEPKHIRIFIDHYGTPQHPIAKKEFLNLQGPIELVNTRYDCFF